MTSINRSIAPPSTSVQEEKLFARADPTLWPHMLLPRRRLELPFPFGDPRVRYSYFARNGIFELARLLDLGGREVLFPAYFHGVELEALLAAGVRPRYFPVRRGMRVDPDEVVARIGPQTRAVYLIHYAGFPGPVAELSEACRERGLMLIEDCALSLLSHLGDRPLGKFSDAAVFCLYKTLPTPNGGAVVLHSDQFRELPEGEGSSLTSVAAFTLFSLLRNIELRGGPPGRLLSRTVRTLGKGPKRAAQLTYVHVGDQHFDRSHLELSMGGFSHVVIKAQDFPSIVERRRRNYSRLLDQLGDVAPSVLGTLPPGVCPLFYPIQMLDKPATMARLRARGVETVNFWSLPHPAGPVEAFPAVDELRRTVLEIPCHQDLTPSAIDRVVRAVREVVKESA